jgi:hypothetical protein
LAKKWAQRADTAAKRLVAPGLDACDMAVERAFEAVKKSIAENFQLFGLQVDISGNTLNAAYLYKDGKLAAFQLYKLPSRWAAKQRVGSKTLSIFVADSNCAFDLCTDDPFASGPCPGDIPE